MYCDKHNLNPNSFRRELAAYKKSAENEPTEKADKSGARTKEGAKKPATSQSKPQPKQQKQQDQKPHTEAQKPAKKGKGAGSTRVPRIQVTVNARPNVVNRPDGTRTFVKGNTASLKHGAYSQLLSKMDLDCDPADFTLGDLGMLVKSRIIGMAKIRQAQIKALEEAYAMGHQMTRTLIGPEGEYLQPMTLLEAIEEIEFAGLDPLGKLVGLAAQLEEKAVSLEKARLDMAHMSKADIVETTAELLMQRTAENLSAMQTCELFAKSGIEPPKLLVLEAEKELKELKPPADEGGGITKEQMEDARRKSLQRRMDGEKELEEKRKWLELELASVGHTGEVRVTESPDIEDEDMEPLLLEDDFSPDDLELFE